MNKNPLEPLVGVIDQAIVDWQTAHPEKKVYDDVLEMLNVDAEALVYVMFGVRKMGSSLEIDPWAEKTDCNVKGAVKKHIGKIVQGTLIDVASKIDISVLKTLIENEFKKQLKNGLTYQVEQLIAGEVKSKVKSCIAEISNSDYIKNYVDVNKALLQS